MTLTMTTVVVALVVAAAGPEGPVVTGAAGDMPLFTREEPHLAAGRRALLSDDVDTAIERFRRAAATTDTERAVIEYDVGQALTMRALVEAKAAQEAASSTTTPAQPGAGPPASPPDVDEALAAFERAATLARDPRLVSEARLAAGNAALVGGKLDDAIATLRKALVADPQNERARRNLQRALTMKQQQPPPPPQDGDGDKQDQKDGDKQDQKDGDKQDQKDGDKQDQKDGDKQDQKDGEDEKKQGDDEEKPADGEQKPGEAPQPVKPKPTSKEEARRLLQGLRSRERPLSPLEMRGVEKRLPAPAGKEW